MSLNLYTVPSQSTVDETANPGVKFEVDQVLIALTNLQAYLQTTTRISCIFSDTVTPGQVISVYSNAGVLTARLANSTDNTKPVYGFCGPLGVSAGTVGEVVLTGLNPYLSALSPGLPYYLHTVNGQISSAKPVGVGKIVQPVGFAISATTLVFNPNNNWTQL